LCTCCIYSKRGRESLLCSERYSSGHTVVLHWSEGSERV
jgi:hypothetical protein